MAVDFCDYFWGEKHDGYHVLHQNLKAGFMATKDLADTLRETALIQENNSKSYAKISKQLGSSVHMGSFNPMLLALKSSSEKLSAIHSTAQTKINELLKDLEKFSVELHKKQKILKDEESPTSEVVKSLQDTTVNLQKSKELYKVRASELEKIKRESLSVSPKELEKAETKFRKSQEDYKTLCEKYHNVRDDFEKKMLTSCKHFQQAETLFLTQMVDIVHSFHDLIDRNHNDVGKVNLELEENLVVNTVEKMLEQFVLQKYTGLVKPGPLEFEAETVSLSSLSGASAIPGGPGPASDISDKSANSDRGPDKAPPAVKKESTGFLKNRRKKDRKKSAKSKDDLETEPKDIGSDGEERGRSETPTPEQNDEEGFRNPPSTSNNNANDPWADFNQPEKKSFYSSSDSDSDDEEVKKIRINIKPIEVGAGTGRSATSASVDELQRAVGGIDLNVATLPKRPTPSHEVESSQSSIKKSLSTAAVNRPTTHSQDLFELFASDANFDSPEVAVAVPEQAVVGQGRLDNSANSELSKEVSDLLSDINNLNSDMPEVTEEVAEEDTEEITAGTEEVPALPSSQPPPASNSSFGWAGSPSFSDSVPPTLPQKTRPSSVQREKVASSLISLPRPPSRARPEGRLRGTPSPTPASLLQSTALSIHRTESSGSNSPSLEQSSSVRQPKVGPLMARPESPPSEPPPNPPPTLQQSFTSSRGPSPLTFTTTESVPLAVAFQEVVHAAFRGAEESRCLVRLLGDMMLSFPAGIVSVFASNPYPAPLQFKIKNAGRLESVLPNKQLISKVKNACTESTLVFEFNMSSLQDLLNKQSQLNPQASYFNIDILKYQITPLSGANSCPFHIMSYWRCEEAHTDLKIDYKYNQHSMEKATSLQNVSISVPVDGGVTDMVSQPKGVWLDDTRRAIWRFSDVNTVGSIRARFQLSDGPGSQGTIAAQFNCEGTTMSGVEFELVGIGYRVSLVKRRFVSGKYVSESDTSTDKYRYAAPPLL